MPRNYFPGLIVFTFHASAVDTTHSFYTENIDSATPLTTPVTSARPSRNKRLRGPGSTKAKAQHFRCEGSLSRSAEIDQLSPCCESVEQNWPELINNNNDDGPFFGISYTSQTKSSIVTPLELFFNRPLNPPEVVGLKMDLLNCEWSLLESVSLELSIIQCNPGKHFSQEKQNKQSICSLSTFS